MGKKYFPLKAYDLRIQNTHYYVSTIIFRILVDFYVGENMVIYSEILQYYAKITLLLPT